MNNTGSPASEAYIVDAIRLPRARVKKSGGAYAKHKPVELVASLLHGLAERQSVATNHIESLLLGCSTQSGTQGANIAKIASLYAGWPQTIYGSTISSFCCSGLEAINLTASKVKAGIEDLAIAGGVEHLSSAAMFSDRGAWFNDPDVAQRTGFMHMGLAADLIACQQGYSRTQLDEISLQSHQRSARATEKGKFNKSLVAIHPNYLHQGQKSVTQDDGIRHSTPEQLQELSPSFTTMIDDYRALVKQHYPDIEFQALHTSANSPALVDGASLLLIANEYSCDKYQLTPRAKISHYSSASDEPIKMLTGHIRATEKLLNKTGLNPSDIDLWEVNESFAATILLFQQSFAIDKDCLNVNGGAIALGHPLGATGGNLVSMLIDELEARQLNRGVVTICGAAGLGVSTLIERVF